MKTEPPNFPHLRRLLAQMGTPLTKHTPDQTCEGCGRYCDTLHHSLESEWLCEACIGAEVCPHCKSREGFTEPTEGEYSKCKTCGGV